jgi:hypothetical protein
MARTPKNVVIRLETLFWIGDPIRPQHDDFGETPCVWPVFLKIDGATTQVAQQNNFIKLIGTATVSGTTGTGRLDAFLKPDNSVAIPVSMGQWADQVQPIPIDPSLGLDPDAPGIFGVVVLVIDPGGLEDNVLEAGHTALNDSLQKGLDKLITDLNPVQGTTQAQIDALVQAVQGAVEGAISDALGFWEGLEEYFFDTVTHGYAFERFDQDGLPADKVDQKDFNPTFPSGTVGFIGVNGAVSQSLRGVGQGILSNFQSGVRAVAGYADDTYQHAIVGTEDGTVTEIWWQGPGGVGQGTLSTFSSGIVSLAGFYSADGYQHVIVATDDREVTELWWQGPGSVGRGVLSSFGSPIVGVAGYYSGDGFQNVIVATQDGDIHELWWQGGGAVGQGVIAHFDSPVVDLAGYYAPDAYHHVIVLTADGTVNELYWQGPAPAGQVVLAQVEAQLWNTPIGVGAHYASTDDQQHIVVATSNGTLREFFWTPGDGVALRHDDLTTIPSLRPIIDTFYDAGGYQHVIAATDDGNVHEVWWSTPSRIVRPPVGPAVSRAG